jgi:integrase
LDRYRKSSAWAALQPATRCQSENIYKSVIKTAGTELLRNIITETIKAGRERRAATPHAANNFLKAMRRFFKWAADPEGGNLVKVNPTIGVKLLKGKNDKDGFHTWTNEEITCFEKRWPIGTRERLALDLLLYTGLARGDVVRLGRQHVSDGVITFRMEKNRGDRRRLPASIAGPGRNHCCIKDRRFDVSCDRARNAVRQREFWQLVP